MILYQQVKDRPSSLIEQLLLTMRLAAFFTLITVFQASAEGFSQTITLQSENITLVKAMQSIQQQSGHSFFLNGKDLANIKLKVQINNLSLENAMDELLKGKPVDWVLTEETIILKTSPAAKPPVEMKDNSTTKAFVQQKIKLTGKVTDAIDDSSIPGAAVSIVGTNRGTTTDINGVYELLADEGDSLRFSFIGYEHKTIKVGKVKVINIRLSQDTKMLDEAVVVAFGTQSKESVVSSITTLNTKELRVPSSNLTTALAGRMAGLVAYQATGAPGEEDAQFFIRSVTSFGSGLTSPLILIDNIEVTSKDLSRLNPDDIASFSILKDASATALYGARGANGVVLVTTKEGKRGAVKTSVRYESALSSPTTRVDVADPIKFMEYSNIASMTRHGELTYPQSKIQATKDPNRDMHVYPSVDWKDMLTQNHSTNHRANINISGGGNAATYYLAGAFSQDNGILKVDKANPFNTNIDLKKFSLRSNVNLFFTKTLEAKVRVSANFDDYTGPMGEFGSGGANTYEKTLLANPVLFPAFYKPDFSTQYIDRVLFGNYTGDPYGVGSPQYINPYTDVMKGYEDVRNNTLLSQLELHQDLNVVTKGLKARFIGSLTRYSGFNIRRSYKPYFYQYIKGSYDPSNTAFPYELASLNPEGGSDYIDYTSGNKFVQARAYAEGAIIYNRNFSKKHDVGGLLVGSLKESMDGSPSNLDSSLPSRNVSLAGRFTYGLDRKYFVEANFGLNGSERFDPKYRWGFFPSIGAGWQVSDEKFWTGIKKIIPSLKLRATYGLVGNDIIVDDDDRFFFTSNIDLNGPSAGGFGNDPRATFTRPTITTLRYANPQITWEISYKTNLAVELGLFNNDLTLVAEVYHEKRTNIVQVRQDVSSTVGLTAGIKTNYGEAVGKGLDLTLNYNKGFSNSMWYILRGNFTYGTANITVYDELDYSGTTPWKSVVGRKVGQSQGYVAERLFIDDNEVSNSPLQQVGGSNGPYQAGDIKYRDINGDGIINSFDIVPMGYPATPEIQYGLGGSFGYKGFDFSVFLQGSSRFSFFLNANSMAPFVDVYTGELENGKWTNNGSKSGQMGNRAMLNFIPESLWTETNRDLYAQWPRLSPDAGGTASGNNNNFVRSNYWMRSASFIRLKSLELGYQLPKVRGMEPRIYASGTNLFTISDFKLWDPEMRGNGLSYPLQRVINLGIQVNF